MSTKLNETNERMKRKFAVWRREADGADHKTVDKELEAVRRFEVSTGVRSFKLFRVDQAVDFKRKLEAATNPKTKQSLSKATIDGILRGVKTFFRWLADQPGYRSRIKHSDVQYFSINAKDARTAHARREVHYPTIEQCRHAFSLMPEVTPIERRNKALFAFLMLTGARIGALASLRLKHVDVAACCVYQDAREVKTKASKTFTTWFFPVDDAYADFLCSWVEFLVRDMLFGPQDALFPKPTVGVVDGEFAVTGLSRETYQGTTQLREVIGNAFANAGLPRFHPHGFRKTLVALANEVCKTPEEFKAWSQNLGHDSVITTVSAYLPVFPSRQRDLIRGEARA
jgi:integrase